MGFSSVDLFISAKLMQGSRLFPLLQLLQAPLVDQFQVPISLLSPALIQFFQNPESSSSFVFWGFLFFMFYLWKFLIFLGMNWVMILEYITPITTHYSVGPASTGIGKYGCS